MSIKPSQIVRSRIKNAHERAVILIVEPWGEELNMPPGSVYEIVAEGPNDGCIEFSLDDKGFVIYGWSGSTVSICQNHQPLFECRIPVPPMPSRWR